MIKSLTYKRNDGNGYLDKLYLKPNEDERTFEFSDDINLIYGRNGSGKTTLINLIASEFCVESENVRQMVDKIFMKVYGKETIESVITNPKCFYVDKVNSFNRKKELDSALCGFGNKNKSFKEIFCGATEYTSTGEESIRIMEECIKLDPNIDIESEILNTDDYFFVNKELIKLFENVKEIEGKPTILIDELDTGLDFISIINYFNLFLKEDLASKFQVIFVTHSLFIIERAIKDKNINCISLLNEDDDKFLKNYLKIVK